MSTPPTLLVCFAHPDDEVLGTGGIMARTAAAGGNVYLVCATRGEVGEISDPALATPETISEVRTRELETSARALGIHPPLFLDYRDSGMRDTPPNHDPRAFINASDADVVEKLVRMIRQLRPHIVITFDVKGGYGHPDHIAIHHHTVAAFHAAADPARFPEAGPAWQAARLFYRALTLSRLETMRAVLESVGGSTAIFDHYQQVGMVWPDEGIHLSVDVSAEVEAKWGAFLAHATQFGADHPWKRAERSLVNQLFSTEKFVLAWPEVEPGTKLEGLLT